MKSLLKSMLLAVVALILAVIASPSNGNDAVPIKEEMVNNFEEPKEYDKNQDKETNEAGLAMSGL